MTNNHALDGQGRIPMNRLKLLTVFVHFLAENQLCDRARLEAEWPRLCEHQQVVDPNTALQALRSWNVGLRQDIADAQIVAEFYRSIHSSSQRMQDLSESAEQKTHIGAEHQPSSGTTLDRIPSEVRAGRTEFKEIGRGAMGVVYACRNKKLLRTEIMKMVVEGADPEWLVRFGNEARTLAQISHPNVVTIYDVYSGDGQPCILIEHIAGKDLEECLDEVYGRRKVPSPTRTWSLGQKLQCFLGIVRGVAAIHSIRPGKLIHRDLKPANIMVRETGEPVVLDFGLAGTEQQVTYKQGQSAANSGQLLAPDLTQAGSVLGTPAYMAPEQALGDPLTQAADITALGKIIYEMITGLVLHHGSSLFATMEICANDDPSGRVREEFAALQIPDGVMQITLKCLLKDPADRYQDAGELEDALEAYFENERRVAHLEEQTQIQRMLDQERELDRAAESNRRFKWGIGIGAAIVALVTGLLINGNMQARARADAEATARTQAEAREKAEAEARANAEAAASADRQRLDSERRLRQVSDGIKVANSYIATSHWEAAKSQLLQVLALDSESSQAHELLAQCLAVLDDANVRLEYAWLANNAKRELEGLSVESLGPVRQVRFNELLKQAEGDKGVALNQLRAEMDGEEQGYRLFTLLAVDTMPDTTPAEIQVQIETCEPILAQLRGRAQQMAQILSNLFVIHQTQLRELEGMTDPRTRSELAARIVQAQRKAFQPLDTLATQEYTSWQEAYFMGCMLAMSGDTRTQQALVLINRAVTLNSNFYMSLWWRQELLRRLVNLVPNRDRQLNYADLRLALSDLTRLKQMKPTSELIDVYMADCLVEIVFHDTEAEAVLRQSRIQTAAQIMASLNPRVGALDSYTRQQFYLSGAKVFAIRWRIEGQEAFRETARRMLQEAQRFGIDPSYYIYRRVEMILRQQ